MRERLGMGRAGWLVGRVDGRIGRRSGKGVVELPLRGRLLRVLLLVKRG